MRRWNKDCVMRSRNDQPWLQKHRLLLAALGISLVVHVLATIGTPIWFDRWRQTETVRFDAVLTPMATAELNETVVRVKSLSTPTTPPRIVRKRAPRPPPTPKSDANFAAPENAIAVEQATVGDTDATVANGADNGSKVADANAETPSTAAQSPIIDNVPAVVAEKRASSDLPEPIPTATLPVELPSRVSIAYKATTSIADGVAHYIWKRDGDKYSFESTIAASGFFVNMFAGTFTQLSTGIVTDVGLLPDEFTIRRGDKPPETAEFLRATKEIKLTRDGQSRQLPLSPNLQDTQSFLFQLAIESVKLKTVDDRLTILVTNARGVNRYTFKKVGESTVETRFGPIETVHLVRETTEPRDGYEVWLSPKHHYLPVKLKFFVDRFPAELIATNITSKP